MKMTMLAMGLDRPPEQGAVYRGKTGKFRRVEEVRKVISNLTANSYEVRWRAVEPNGTQWRSLGATRANWTWCSTWEAWEPRRMELGE